MERKVASFRGPSVRGIHEEAKQRPAELSQPGGLVFCGDHSRGKYMAGCGSLNSVNIGGEGVKVVRAGVRWG